MSFGDHDSKVKAAAELEDLSAEIPEIIRALRNNDSDSYGYVYHLRRRLTRIVSTLGVGTPSDPWQLGITRDLVIPKRKASS